MKNRKKRNKDELHKALEHIQYEFDMLVAVSNGLASGVFGTSALNNSVVESFAIHSRNLIDFLWPEKPKNDHVIAEDYFCNSEEWEKIKTPLPDILKKARIRAHKEIAHISYDRIKLEKDDKPWNFILITELISENMNIFLKSKMR
jgi:hypothetical protein